MSSALSQYKRQVDEYLLEYLPKQEGSFKELYEAMTYSVVAGGKRIRAILMQLAYEAVGGTESIGAYLSAIEMIHTYSLIHDDLPAMDDDDLRRGKPTNHKVFGEATAILAGDALLNLAFETMLTDALESEDQAKVKAMHILATASGSEGMIAGQVLDMASEHQNIDEQTLICIHAHKTGALFTAALKAGAVLGYGTPVEVAALEAYGKYIGRVFQIVDDILDETADESELGKPIKSDLKNEKITYTSFYSIEACYALAETLTQKAIDCLARIEGDTQLLEELAYSLVHRKK